MAEPVKLRIGGYQFACYRLSEAQFINIAAVYVIIGVKPDKGWDVLDVGQSGELGERMQDHPRREEWFQEWPNGNIWVCILPTPSSRYTEQDRTEIEGRIRQRYSPPCGKR